MELFCPDDPISIGLVGYPPDSSYIFSEAAGHAGVRLGQVVELAPVHDPSEVPRFRGFLIHPAAANGTTLHFPGVEIFDLRGKAPEAIREATQAIVRVATQPIVDAIYRRGTAPAWSQVERPSHFDDD
jgi:hypothetical protein